jgi:hypothetical protein
MDISFKDDVTVIFLLGVSVMQVRPPKSSPKTATQDNYPQEKRTLLETSSKKQSETHKEPWDTSANRG